MENIAQPETPGDDIKVSVYFRCPKAVKRALKMRAAEKDKSIEQLCLEAVLRELSQEIAA